jgi:hypothetical protein
VLVGFLACTEWFKLFRAQRRDLFERAHLLRASHRTDNALVDAKRAVMTVFPQSLARIGRRTPLQLTRALYVHCPWRLMIHNDDGGVAPLTAAHKAGLARLMPPAHVKVETCILSGTVPAVTLKKLVLTSHTLRSINVGYKVSGWEVALNHPTVEQVCIREPANPSTRIVARGEPSEAAAVPCFGRLRHLYVDYINDGLCRFLSRAPSCANLRFLVLERPKAVPLHEHMLAMLQHLQHLEVLVTEQAYNMDAILPLLAQAGKGADGSAFRHLLIAVNLYSATEQEQRYRQLPSIASIQATLLDCPKLSICLAYDISFATEDEREAQRAREVQLGPHRVLAQQLADGGRFCVQHRYKTPLPPCYAPLRSFSWSF